MLPPFKLPPDYIHLVTRPTALEARHAAATYALFRVCSMKRRNGTTSITCARAPS